MMGTSKDLGKYYRNHGNLSYRRSRLIQNKARRITAWGKRSE